MSTNCKKIKKGRETLYFFVFFVIFMLTPCIALSQEPSLASTSEEAQSPEPQKPDTLASVYKIISLYEKLAQEFNNILLLEEDDLASQGLKAKIEQFLAHNQETKTRFYELAQYLAESEQLQELPVRDLMRNLRESLKGLLDEARDVLDDSLHHSTSIALDKLELRKLEFSDLMGFVEEDQLPPQMKIQKSVQNIGDVYFSHLDKLDKKDIYTINNSLIDYNKFLLSLEKLQENLQTETASPNTQPNVQ